MNDKHEKAKEEKEIALQWLSTSMKLSLTPIKIVRRTQKDAC